MARDIKTGYLIAISTQSKITFSDKIGELILQLPRVMDQLNFGISAKALPLLH